MADFNDTLRFLQPVSCPGGVTLSTTTGAPKAAMVQYASKAFLLASITAGSLTFTNATDIPANAIIHGAYIVTSTQPTFGGTTTGGLVGTYVTFTAITPGVWGITGGFVGSGTLADPFITT